MKPYPLVALNHFTVPVATTLSTVHTTAQTSYGRALPPDTAQNTKTRDPKVIAAATETPRGAGDERRQHGVAERKTIGCACHPPRALCNFLRYDGRPWLSRCLRGGGGPV